VPTPEEIQPVNRKHVYLAGAIEYAPDGGKAWRLELKDFIEREIGFSVFDPCVNEIALLSEEEKLHLRTWKVSQREKFLPVMRRIIDHDLFKLLNHTRFVICLWDEHVMKGAGTAGELTAAYQNGIPVYVVAAIPMQRMSSWVIGCATEVFSSMDEIKEFLLLHYAAGIPISGKND
jgi:hypothetical protein